MSVVGILSLVMVMIGTTFVLYSVGFFDLGIDGMISCVSGIKCATSLSSVSGFRIFALIIGMIMWISWIPLFPGMIQFMKTITDTDQEDVRLASSLSM